MKDNDKSKSWAIILAAIITAIVGPIVVQSYRTRQDAITEREMLSATVVALQTQVMEKDTQAPQSNVDSTPLHGNNPTPTKPKPTDSPAVIQPTNTPTAVRPTNTPAPTSTPTPDHRLFWDDFESGIRPEWGFTGDDYAVTNGRLVVESGGIESQTIGDSSWRNYTVKAEIYSAHTSAMATSEFSIMLRVQDRNNYIRLFCHDRQKVWSDGPFCVLKKRISGKESDIADASFGLLQGIFDIEVVDNTYSVYSNGERKVIHVDVNDTFTTGGIKFSMGGHKVAMEGVEVMELP